MYNVTHLFFIIRLFLDSYLDQLFMVQKVVDDTTDLLDMVGTNYVLFQ